MSRFKVTSTPIPDLKVIERQPVGDDRGFLCRLFCADELATAGWHKPIAQINQTLTHKQGAVRGMHYQQAPDAEMKLVTCLKGTVWDVAIDLRETSPTFLQWHAEELSEQNLRALLIPEGFAHGFQAMAENVELIYLHSAPYSQRSEAGLNPQDPSLAISWPLQISEISQRDRGQPFLNDDFGGVTS